MKKLIAGIVVLGLLVALGSAYVIASNSPTVQAQLHVEDGTVSVNGKSVTGNVHLVQGDVIQTGAGHATVILHESLMASLEPNSQVTLDDLLVAHPQLSQQAGRTWNTFTKLSGVQSYSIKFGTTVATVRGTAFEFSDRMIVVREGTVEYLFNGRLFTVTAGRVVQNGVARAATPAELARVGAYRLRSVQELRYLRQLEIDKHALLISLVKQMYIDDAKLNRYMEDADNSRIDIDAKLARVPVRPASLMKIVDITKAIQKILHES
jgi:hypothetical protein